MATGNEITITDLTQGTLQGEGVFDQLMRAGKAHLEEEFRSRRIQGPEYATVYLGMIQTTMDQAIRFLLEHRQAGLQADLIAEQVESEGINQELLNVRVINAGKEGEVLDGQKCKLDAEFDLLQEQRLKTVAETALLGQKMATEKAQTVGAGIDADSVIGSQKALYQAQRDGYVRDAEQKAAKLMADTWNVRRTTDEGTQANTTNKLDDASVGRAIAQLLEGIGA